jgi:two-component system, chemotaxis family, CheB/CheR fusion protein
MAKSEKENSKEKRGLVTSADIPGVPTQGNYGISEPGESSAHVFSIVGIGASAGGLEALEKFFVNVPKDSGLAFVVVQHLDPTRKGMLPELLQRATNMRVFQIKDQMPIEADCVYIIPPNKDLSVLHGKFHLMVPLAPRGLRLPIDFFFRSLADDQQNSSIGVILSGMGSDGTLGISAIKEKAGGVFVQDPASAKFDGMPNSAIESGHADVVAPVEELPGKIIAYLQHVPPLKSTQPLEIIDAKGTVDKIIILLRSHTGHDFSFYKRTTLDRRIERRMGLHQIKKVDTYLAFLQKNPKEIELLFNELLIGVTRFFRNPESWELIQEKHFSSIVSADLPANHILRAWVPGCSTGEEAYSLAILFHESLQKFSPGKNISMQIFATDLDMHAIEKARAGVFPENIVADVSEERLKKYFKKSRTGYQVAKSIRDMIIFAPQNVIMDPPFTKLDFISCRNLLIYLNAEAQKKLIPLFHYCLNPDGVLFLGNSETVGNFTQLFRPINKKVRLYCKKEFLGGLDPDQFPTSFTTKRYNGKTSQGSSIANLQTLADQLILQTYSPPAVLSDDKGDILYINGRTGKYLEPAAGKVNWNIFAMAREEIRFDLSTGFRRAVRQKGTITSKDLIITVDGKKQKFNIVFKPLNEPPALRGMVLVIFKDSVILSKETTIPKLTSKSNHVTIIEQHLEDSQIELQKMREEMQRSQEELKSANEELQSTNEELQSTNEELTTSKEELQSLNEEMHTINNELEARVNELSRINNDMKNLLDSTDIGTLFLDNQLLVRRFTNEMSKITNLIPTDTGRPISDIASALLYPNLIKDAGETLKKLVKIERQVRTPDGDWYAVRILPYRTLENVIDGVVITFVDITVQKNLELKLIENQRN